MIVKATLEYLQSKMQEIGHRPPRVIISKKSSNPTEDPLIGDTSFGKKLSNVSSIAMFSDHSNTNIGGIQGLVSSWITDGRDTAGEKQ